MCGPSAAEQTPSPPAGDFGLVGGPEVLWAYQYRIEGPQDLRLLRFAYRRADEPASADRGFAKPLRLGAVSGDLIRAAIRGDSLHVFYVDGTHLRYHPKGSTVERNLPDQSVPPALVGDEVREVLYALVPASVAQALREPQPEPTTRPQSTTERESPDEHSDQGPDLTAPAGDYAIVRYQRGAWRRDRDAPQWLTLDLVGSDGPVWLAASDGVCHLFAPPPAAAWASELDAANGELLYSRSDGEAWTAPRPVPGIRLDRPLLAAVHRGEVLLLVRSPTNGTPSLVRGTQDGFAQGPALAGAGRQRGAPGSRCWAVFGDRLAAGFLNERGELSVGYWSLVDGSVLAEPAPVEALIPRSPSWAEQRLSFIACGLLAVLLVGVLWRRRDSLAVPAALPADQTTARHPRRLAAFVLDFLITLPVWALVMLPAVPPTLSELTGSELETALRGMQSKPEFAVRWLIAAGLFATYATVFEASMGATPGKRLLQCRVVNEQGQRCRFGAVALRNLIRVIEMFYLFQLMPAIILILLTRNRQRLGDLVAGTIVVERTFPADTPEGRDSNDTAAL